MKTKDKVYMSKSPLETKLPYVYILYRELSPSFKKRKSEYHYKISAFALLFSIVFFIVGLSLFRPTIEFSLVNIVIGFVMISASIFQWFYIKSKESHFNFQEKKFYQKNGDSYSFNEIKGLQLLEYIEDSKIKYQLNLVFDGLAMNRINLIESYSLAFIKKELHQLSKLLEIPVFDSSTGKPETRSHFLFKALLIMIIIGIMFYISVGHMFFPLNF